MYPRTGATNRIAELATSDSPTARSLYARKMTARSASICRPTTSKQGTAKKLGSSAHRLPPTDWRFHMAAHGLEYRFSPVAPIVAPSSVLIEIWNELVLAFTGAAEQLGGLEDI